MKIDINNLTTNEVNQDFIRKVVGSVLEKEGTDPESEISLVFVGRATIRNLNKKFRRINRATDILAFSEREVSFEKFQITPLIKTKSLGEMVICLREVKKSARRLGVSFNRELARVLIHGVLHLLGYDHEKSCQEKEKMKKKEDQYLKLLEI